MSSALVGCPDIEDLFVSPEHRSLGIGAALLGRVEELARQKKYAQIGLGVAIENLRARSLYMRNGYVDSDLGEYDTGGIYIGKDGREKTWRETCHYLVKPLA